MQVLIAIVLTTNGTVFLAGGPQPNSVDQALATPYFQIWAAGLAIGGALVVAAALTPPLPALYLELIADLPLTLLCLAYSGAVIGFAGARGALPAGIALAAAIAFARRWQQVRRTFTGLRQLTPAR